MLLKGSSYIKNLINSNVEKIGGSVFGLSWTDCHGKFDKSKNPESEMSQILPQQMHSYFFFNGERIEKTVVRKF